MSFLILAVCLFSILGRTLSAGILYPRLSETRDQILLDGLWNFALTPPGDLQRGFREAWFKKDLITLADIDIYKMPVPASYNDITTDPKIRDYVGIAWYDRTFFVPHQWPSTSKVWIRFGSVDYSGQVYINGELAASHEIGHLPFEAEISSLLNFGQRNRITVAVNNILSSTTIPQGNSYNETTDDGVRLVNSYSFDFFNYAGIHRSVILYTTPEDRIDDISVTYSIDDDGTTGRIDYRVTYVSDIPRNELVFSTNLYDKNGETVPTDEGVGEEENAFVGTHIVENANLWWPYLMHDNPGYLYELEVKLLRRSDDQEIQLLDTYRLPVGIRTINWTDSQLLINNVPVYLRGFGRHEDSDIRGKGVDLSTILRDYNLIKWIGANAYRTSHYPYAEEIMDLADENGIMIIDEVPAVNIEGFSNALLENHKESLTQLINRDKNRPSVIIWSVANEPRTEHAEADAYFEAIIAHVKELDTTRPTTLALDRSLQDDHSSKHVDIVSINRYYGWYSYEGRLDMIENNVVNDVKGFRETYTKPVLVSEYGADTYEGYHSLPSFVWSEEFQDSYMSKYFKAFDQVRLEGIFIGEFIWNFADFKTDQDAIRVGGNKKGIFTRNRQPKASAHLLRRRYWSLAHEYDDAPLPEDLDDYVTVNTQIKTEL